MWNRVKKSPFFPQTPSPPCSPIKPSRRTHTRTTQVGNVYAKFGDEEEADDALKGLAGRYYAGRLLEVEFSPVTDFREARCRQYDEGQCTYGPYCNFLHLKRIGRYVRCVFFCLWICMLVMCVYVRTGECVRAPLSRSDTAP
jgi:hypothetical protein